MKMATSRRYFYCLFTVAVFTLLIQNPAFAQVTPSANGIVYVNKNVLGGSQNGSSWANALPELADALKSAHTNSAIQQIWVARGTYQPLYSAGTDNMNFLLQFGNPGGIFNSFVMVNNVRLYGGFQNANETSITERDTVNNNTVLSGNNFNLHVVMSAGGVGSAELNGFTITGGAPTPVQVLYVNSIATYSTRGGGIYIVNSAPLITNCVITDNTSEQGAGIYAINSAIKITKSRVVQNNAVGGSGGHVQSVTSGRGGGIAAFNCYQIDILDSNVDSNSAVSVSQRAIGGGVWAHNIASNMVINIQNTTINHNTASSIVTQSNNTATGYGGGLYAAIENHVGTLNINNSSIEHNSLTVLSSGRAHSSGGGMATNCSLNVDNSSIKFNQNNATGANLGENEFCNGGGIYYSGRAGNIRNSVIEGNSIDGNINPSGGGIYNDNVNFNGSSLTVSNCKIVNNTAGAYGGGIYSNNSQSAKFYNTLIANNNAAKGGAACNSEGYYVAGKLTLINCTVVDNSALEQGNYDAVYNIGDSSKTFVHNSILWGKKMNDLLDARTSATYSIVQANTLMPGTGNLNTAPQFMNAASDDFRLQATSPAANAGSNAIYATVGNINSDTDLSGDPRLFETIIDMGAYELQQRAIDTTTSVASVNSMLNHFKLYPNPVAAGSNVTIHAAYAATDLRGAVYTLSDVSGRIVQVITEVKPLQTLMLPDVAGMYLLSIVLPKGGRVAIPVAVK